jgi:type IV secretory pathway TrbD component
MTELEVIRVACDALPEPSEASVSRARRALRRETVPRGHARAFVLTTGLAVAAAAAIALVVTTRQGSFGVRVASAAIAAMNPADDRIVHAVARTSLRFHSRVGTTRSRWTTESWWTTQPPTSVDRVDEGAGRTTTTFASACGAIVYDSTQNLFTIHPGAFDPIRDPLTAAANALRHGRIRYRGELSFRGIPAAKLVVTQYGSTTTYIVRRDNGYPLQTIDRRVTSYSTRVETTTYSLFAHVPRTAGNERHVALTPHPGALVVRTAPAARTSACAAFGSYGSLTGRRTVR